MSQETVILLCPRGTRAVLLLELWLRRLLLVWGQVQAPFLPLQPIYTCGCFYKSLLICGPYSGSALTAYSCNDGVEERSNFRPTVGWLGQHHTPQESEFPQCSRLPALAAAHHNHTGSLKHSIHHSKLLVRSAQEYGGIALLLAIFAEHS